MINKDEISRRRSREDAIFVDKFKRKDQFIEGILGFLILFPIGLFLFIRAFYLYQFPPSNLEFFLLLLIFGLFFLLIGILILIANLKQIPTMIFKDGYYPGTYPYNARKWKDVFSGTVKIYFWDEIKEVTVSQRAKGVGRRDLCIAIKRDNMERDELKIFDDDIPEVLKIMQKQIPKKLDAKCKDVMKKGPKYYW